MYINGLYSFYFDILRAKQYCRDYRKNNPERRSLSKSMLSIV